MQTILNFVDKGGRIRLKDFKIVYVAPMKALAAEVVDKFSEKLKVKLRPYFKAIKIHREEKMTVPELSNFN